jgi:hypothetical protein
MSSTIIVDEVPSTLRDNSGMLLPELADQPDTDEAPQHDLPRLPSSADAKPGFSSFVS